MVMMNIMDLRKLRGKDVFTERGMYCGKVEDIEIDLTRFRVRAIVIAVARGTYLEEMIGMKRGIIVPYSLIRAIGDVVIIRHISVPKGEEEAKEMAAKEM